MWKLNSTFFIVSLFGIYASHGSDIDTDATAPCHNDGAPYGDTSSREVDSVLYTRVYYISSCLLHFSPANAAVSLTTDLSDTCASKSRNYKNIYQKAGRIIDLSIALEHTLCRAINGKRSIDPNDFEPIDKQVSQIREESIALAADIKDLLSKCNPHDLEIIDRDLPKIWSCLYNPTNYKKSLLDLSLIEQTKIESLWTDREPVCAITRFAKIVGIGAQSLGSKVGNEYDELRTACSNVALALFPKISG
jgi:hypothetical protein